MSHKLSLICTLFFLLCVNWPSSFRAIQARNDDFVDIIKPYVARFLSLAESEVTIVTLNETEDWHFGQYTLTNTDGDFYFLAVFEEAGEWDIPLENTAAHFLNLLTISPPGLVSQQYDVTARIDEMVPDNSILSVTRRTPVSEIFSSAAPQDEVVPQPMIIGAATAQDAISELALDFSGVSSPNNKKIEIIHDTEDWHYGTTTFGQYDSTSTPVQRAIPITSSLVPSLISNIQSWNGGVSNRNTSLNSNGIVFCPAPGVPTIVQPANGASVVAANVTVLLTSGSSNGGRQQWNVQVDNNSDFSSPVYNTTSPSLNHTITVPSSGTYYVRARQYGRRLWSSWTAPNTFVVTKSNTMTTISVDTPDPSVVGQPVTVYFDVSAVSPGSGIPTGTVTVSGDTDCVATLSDGTGSCTLLYTNAGSKTITATYTGDNNFNSSTSADREHSVNKANTSTTVWLDPPDVSVIGQSVMVYFSVSAVSPGSGTPTGAVSVNGSSASCVGTLESGLGGCTIVFLSSGSTTITANYSGDDNFNNSSNTLSHIVDPGADLSINHTDHADPVYMTEIVTYTTTVTNNGPDATSNVVLIEALSGTGSFAVLSAAPDNGSTCDTNANPITCNLGTLAVGETIIVTVQIETVDNGVLTSNVEVSSPLHDADVSNNIATETTTIAPWLDESDLSVTVVESADPTKSGSRLSYTITLTNNGVKDVSNIVLTLTLPSMTQFQYANGNCSEDNDIVTCSLGTIPSGGSQNIDITVDIHPWATGILTSTVVVSGDFVNTFTVTEDTLVNSLTPCEWADVAPPAGVVNFWDRSAIGARYGCQSGDTNCGAGNTYSYDARYDENRNGIIDLYDIQRVSGYNWCHDPRFPVTPISPTGSFSLEVEDVVLQPGIPTEVDVIVNCWAESCDGFDLLLRYDTNLISGLGLTDLTLRSYEYINQNDNPILPVSIDDNVPGEYRIAWTKRRNFYEDNNQLIPPSTGYGALFTLVITALQEGATLDFIQVDVATLDGTPVPHDMTLEWANVEVTSEISDERPFDNTNANSVNLVYTITVTNHGLDDATNLVVQSILPSGIIYIGDDGNGAYDQGTGLWTIGTLQVDSSAVLHIDIEVPEFNRIITNEVSVQHIDQRASLLAIGTRPATSATVYLYPSNLFDIVIREQEFQAQIQDNIGDQQQNKTITDIEFVLADFVPNGIETTIRLTDGTVGAVSVEFWSNNEFGGFLFDGITAANPDFQAHFEVAVNRELPRLIIDALNSLFARKLESENFDPLHMIFDDENIAVSIYRD